MASEHSYGIIALKDGKTLFVHHQKGHWAFPKGHPDGQESPREAAERELREETGLAIVRFLSLAPIEEHYQFARNGMKVDKHVTYFFAEVSGEVALQEEEIADFRWLTFEEAAQTATFPEMRALCIKAQKQLGI